MDSLICNEENIALDHLFYGVFVTAWNDFVGLPVKICEAMVYFLSYQVVVYCSCPDNLL